jgi:hypothetical protein
MTDRSRDITLNADPVRYGAEPMSAARFKKELGELMDAIKATSPETRFILLSPIRHEDLRKTRPGLPDPAPHNASLEQYSKAIEELAKERSVSFVNFQSIGGTQTAGTKEQPGKGGNDRLVLETSNGIHATAPAYEQLATQLSLSLGWETFVDLAKRKPESPALRAAILRKDDLFFHQFRPANSTYLFGFRKHEQGKNAVEMPQFTPLIEAVDKEIDALKRDPNAKPAAPAPAAGEPKPVLNNQQLPVPNFALADGLEISLWADTNLVGKPVGMNWDAAGPPVDRLLAGVPADHAGWSSR